MSLPEPAQEQMNIVVVGHVDHGKSTVVGRLLADTGALPEGKLAQIRAYCERNARPFEYAFLIDALKDERRQNITIDAARVFFHSAKRRYIIIDAPGHVEFVRNMVTGAARAEAALLVIDAQEGVQENSRRHGNLLSLLGIRQVIVLVNKMDLVDYAQARFESVRDEYDSFLRQVGLTARQYIPVSAREGDNISQPGAHLPWYQGPTVLQALDAFEKQPAARRGPFRMPVQDVYRFTALGDQRRIVAGSVSSGSARLGDEIIFYPSGKRSAIKTFETFHEPARAECAAGQPVGVTLMQQVYIQRGELMGCTGETPPKVARRLRVNLFWLGSSPLRLEKPYRIKSGTARASFRVERILRVMDAASLASDAAALAQVDRYQIAECILALDHALAFDPADTLLETSRFVVVDGYEISGGGLILEGLPDSTTAEREQVMQRNIRWVTGNVGQDRRAERYQQQPCMVIVTGQQDAGRKRLARALEERLFNQGRFIYYLGMGSVIYGVDADLRGHSDQSERREHIRRLAEVANILLDAGLVLIVTAIELTQMDLELLQTIIDASRIRTVWVGDPRTTDIQDDLLVEDAAALDPALDAIELMLHENGVF